MDQTPPFQPSFNLDFFPALHLPHGLALTDSLDLPKHKNSFADHHVEPSYMEHPTFDDMYHDPTHMKAWQPPQGHGFLDVSLDPWFASNKDFGMDPYQICRSRGGSFNFGRLRKESEDFFHMNSDFFKQIRNITESKTPILENAFQKKPFHPQDAMMDMSYNYSDYHSPVFQAPLTQNIQPLNVPAEMMVKAQNTDSTVDTAVESSTDAAAKKRGRKKRILNDKTEVFDEASDSKTAKASKSKKIKEEEDVIQSKLQKSKSLKQNKSAKKGIDMDKDDKSTEISSMGSKIEDSPSGIKPSNDIMSEIMKLKAPENLKEILGGMNVPNEVKEFFQKTSWMGPSGPCPETRKIGTLTIAERRVKIEKYLQKRKKRTWSRKINYDCRKRVADSRLRIKGRFVTRDQAFVLMEEANIPFNPETITNVEIKALLTEKFGASVLKKKSLDKQETTVCLKRPSDRELDELDFEDNDDQLSE